LPAIHSLGREGCCVGENGMAKADIVLVVYGRRVGSGWARSYLRRAKVDERWGRRCALFEPRKWDRFFALGVAAGDDG